MLWINEIEDAIKAADATAVFVVAMPRVRNMQIYVGIQGMQHVADVMISRVRSTIRQGTRFKAYTRFSGMEIIVVVPGLMRLGEIASLGAQLRKICGDPIAVGEETFAVDPVVGISISPEDGQAAQELIARAQIAADNGASTHSKAPIFFTSQMAKVADLACRIEMDLRTAIENRGISIVFQPQFSIASKNFAAVEVLVRWDHPVYGLISPVEFIPIAESAGLIGRLGSLILHEAVIQMTEFRRKTMLIDVAVNVSPSQLIAEDFVFEVEDLLKSTGMEASALTIEITEGELLFDIDLAINQLKQLRKLGVKTSIDDFGAGFSNLAYLHRLPLDQIKIDRSFVQHLNADERAITLLRSSIELGRGLGLEVCVEGVENQRQYRILEKMGCDLIQGYLFSRPLALEDLGAVVSAPPLIEHQNHTSDVLVH